MEIGRLRSAATPRRSARPSSNSRLPVVQIGATSSHRSLAQIAVAQRRPTTPEVAARGGRGWRAGGPAQTRWRAPRPRDRSRRGCATCRRTPGRPASSGFRPTRRSAWCRRIPRASPLNVPRRPDRPAPENWRPGSSRIVRDRRDPVGRTADQTSVSATALTTFARTARVVGSSCARPELARRSLWSGNELEWSLV